jgi:Methyltransferase domain
MKLIPAPPYPLADRLQFADLCSARGIRRAVEVGTDRGLFAEPFLKRWPIGEILVCVDPWAPYAAMPFDRTPDLLIAAQLLAPFRSRVRLLRMTSLEAARQLPGLPYHSPGFVYIDGDHDLPAITADLAAWWPLVVPGGILAGHDYTAECDGVRRAVDALADRLALEVRITRDAEESHSWWIEKPA